jgi:putative spermidine/putrescine transport system substrate-binding protein
MSNDQMHAKGISRRDVFRIGAGVSLGLAAPAGFVRNAWAQSKTMTIGIWAGAQGEYIKKEVISAFMKEYDCRILVNEGWTLPQIAKVRAEKANPQHTVVFVDDLGVELLKREELIDPLPKDKMPNLSKVYPRFVYNDGYGVAIGVSMGGMGYNPTLMKPIESYKDLWDERFRKKLTLLSMKGTSGPFLVMTAAALATGKPFAEAQYLTDSAWDLLKELKPNILNIADSNAQAANQVMQGEVLMHGIDYSKWVYPYTQKGAPIDMCYPKEGTWAGVNCQVLIKNAPNQDLGAEFMNRMLDEKVQTGLAKAALAAPPLPGIELDKETLKYVAYPQEKMDDLKLFSPDWAYVNKARDGWTEKWNQIFAA